MIISKALSNSFLPLIPVESIIGILVSAKAFISGRFVKSLLATFNLSGVNNFNNDKHNIDYDTIAKSINETIKNLLGVC